MVERHPLPSEDVVGSLGCRISLGWGFVVSHLWITKKNIDKCLQGIILQWILCWKGHLRFCPVLCHLRLVSMLVIIKTRWGATSIDLVRETTTQYFGGSRSRYKLLLGYTIISIKGSGFDHTNDHD